jgi:hypothetical protein
MEGRAIEKKNGIGPTYRWPIPCSVATSRILPTEPLKALKAHSGRIPLAL